MAEMEKAKRKLKINDATVKCVTDATKIENREPKTYIFPQTYTQPKRICSLAADNIIGILVRIRPTELPGPLCAANQTDIYIFPDIVGYNSYKVY